MPAPSPWSLLGQQQQNPNDLVGYLAANGWQPPAPTPAPVMEDAAQLQAGGQNVPRGTDNYSTTVARTVPGAPPANQGATQAMLDSLEGRQLESLKAQGLTVQGLQDKLKTLEGSKLPLNLQPVAALVDSWTGSHLAPSLAPEETAQSRQQQIDALQNAILKSQQGLSQDEVQMLKDKLMAQYHAEDVQARSADRQLQRESVTLAHKDAQDSKTGKRETDLLTHAIDKFNSDATVVDATKKVAETSNARQMLELARTNPAVRNTIALDMARLIVPSRLNETEIQSFSGSKKAGDKVGQIFQDMESGTLTDENYRYLKQMVDSLSKHDRETLQGRLDHHATQFSGRTRYTKDEAAKLIGGSVYEAPANGEDAAALEWAKSNPTDPRAAQILSLHGGK